MDAADFVSLVASETADPYVRYTYMKHKELTITTVITATITAIITAVITNLVNQPFNSLSSLGNQKTKLQVTENSKSDKSTLSFLQNFPKLAYSKLFIGYGSFKDRRLFGLLGSKKLPASTFFIGLSNLTSKDIKFLEFKVDLPTEGKLFIAANRSNEGKLNNGYEFNELYRNQQCVILKEKNNSFTFSYDDFVLDRYSGGYFIELVIVSDQKIASSDIQITIDSSAGQFEEITPDEMKFLMFGNENPANKRVEPTPNGAAHT